MTKRTQDTTPELNRRALLTGAGIAAAAVTTVALTEPGGGLPRHAGRERAPL